MCADLISHTDTPKPESVRKSKASSTPDRNIRTTYPPREGIGVYYLLPSINTLPHPHPKIHFQVKKNETNN